MSELTAGRALPLLLLPAALSVYLGFNGGGFFPFATGIAAVALALALALRAAFAARPFEGLGRLAPALVAMVLLAAWTLASGWWSDSYSRALLEFDAVLLYLLALVFAGSHALTSARLRLMVLGLLAGILVVCTAGLITRTLPDVWPISPDLQTPRLGYPVTYWNGLGLLAAVGMVLSFHLASSERESRVARVAGATLTPVLGATLLLTFSRGAVAVAAIGVVTYALLARPRALLSGVLATVPATAVAVAAAYGAELLGTPDPTTPAATAEGHALALTVALCAGAAAAARALLLVLDRRLARLRTTRRLRRRVALSAAAVALAAVAGVAVLSDLPDRAEHQVDRFFQGDPVASTGPARDRFAELANNGRIDQWTVTLAAFSASPVTGEGAGTFQVLWARERPYRVPINDAHGLYMEILGELGIVGLVLLLIAVGTILVGVAARIRGPDRAVYAAVFAAALAWAVHAGVDWDWDLPVTTAWVFALGGLALASRPGLEPRTPAPKLPLRAGVALGSLALAVTPALVAVSQHRLDHAVSALKRGDCAAAVDAARGSISALSVRAEPYELIAYCAARAGSHRTAIRMMERAVERDPDNWELQYGLAVVSAAAGRDPRPAARRALRMNPLNPLARTAVKSFGSSDPRAWKRRARAAPLPIL